MREPQWSQNVGDINLWSTKTWGTSMLNRSVNIFTHNTKVTKVKSQCQYCTKYGQQQQSWHKFIHKTFKFITSVWQKNVGGIPHKVPTPNPAHTLVSVCHKCRNIRSHRLTACYGLHLKRSFVSIQPHSSAHSGDSSTQRPTLPSWPSIRSFTWQRLETSSRSSSRSLDRPTPPELATRWWQRRRSIISLLLSLIHIWRCRRRG